MLLRFDEVAALYRRVLALDPDHDMARLRLATLLMEQAMPTEAAPHLEALRQRQPDNPTVAALLVRCRDQLGQQAEAERLLEELLLRHPSFAPALFERGRLLLRDGRPAQAEPLLRQALAQEPWNQQLRHQLVPCLFRCDRASEAEAEQQRLEQLKMSSKRIEKITTEELPRRPRDPALRCELACLLLDQGQTEEAVQWLSRIMKENPRYEPAHKALAGYYQQAGEPERAAYHRRFLPSVREPNGAAAVSSPNHFTTENTENTERIQNIRRKIPSR